MSLHLTHSSVQNQSQESRILMHYIDGLKKDEKRQFDCLEKSGFLSILLKYAADANANIDQFLTTINQHAHANYRRSSKEYKAIQVLKKEWCAELEAIRKCVDCYDIFTTKDENNDYFTLPCAKPHLLVFVGEKATLRMWPAKVLSVDNYNKMVTIERFGDYLHVVSAFRNCFLYSDAQERAREEENEKYAKNKRIKMQEEYKRSFPEVKKYIENIKKKFGSFVPAVTEVTINDVDQHLVDMFPDAFAQSLVTTGIERQVTRAEEANNVIKIRSIRSAAKQRNSFVSRGYESLSTSAFDSDSDDDTDDFCYSDSDDDTDDYWTSTGMENSHRQNRKRKQCNNAAKQTHHVSRRFKIGHSSQANDTQIAIADEGQDGTEIVTTSPQKVNEHAMNRRNFVAMLDKYREITKEISKYEDQLKQLNTKEATIQKK